MTAHPSLAILGGGPVGIDAAIAGLEQGYRVTVYEQASMVAANVREWGHVQLFTPWDMSVSARSRRWVPDLPTGEACPNGAELADVIERLVASMPSGTVRLGTRVVAVGRTGLVKSDEIGTGLRAGRPFRLLLSGPDGVETTESAAVVLDCTGVYARPNALGDGGVPARGERGLDARIRRRLPDVHGADRTRYAGRATLLVGAGKSAQTAARDVAAVADEQPGTSLVWVVRDPRPSWGEVVDDPLPQRQGLVDVARSFVAGAKEAVQVRCGVWVDALRETAEGRIAATLSDDSEHLVDEVLSLVGSVGDASIHQQLQVHQCYATDGVMSLSAALLGETGGDCLTQSAQGIDALRNPEPDFFILGSKSYGRNNTFLLRAGWEHVDEVIAELGPAQHQAVGRTAVHDHGLTIAGNPGPRDQRM